MPTSDVTRRSVLRCAACAAVTAPWLAGCGDDASTGASPSDPATSASPSESASGDDGGGGGGGATPLVALADVPVGGGVILADQQVVVTQPSEGQVKGFSTTCTHQGCQVGSVEDGVIGCPCHGSQFAIDTGEPQAGPASAPLEEIPVAVQGGQVVRA